MKYEIRQSDPNAQAGDSHGDTFYYLIEIDEDGNQNFIAQDDELSKLQNHPKVKKLKLKPIAEEQTRGQISE